MDFSAGGSAVGWVNVTLGQDEFLLGNDVEKEGGKLWLTKSEQKVCLEAVAPTLK